MMNEIDLIGKLNAALEIAEYKSRVVGVSSSGGLFMQYNNGELEEVILPFVTITAENLLAQQQPGDGVGEEERRWIGGEL